jgi:hypothetical protein
VIRYSKALSKTDKGTKTCQMYHTLPTFPAFSTDADEPNGGEQPLLESSMAYISIGGARSF